MSEAPAGGQDSRRRGRASWPEPRRHRPRRRVDDTYDWYRRGLDLLGRGSPAAAAQLLSGRPRPSRGSRSVLEALGRAQFDARRYARRQTASGRSWRPARADDYAQFGLGLALARDGNPAAAAEHLALAAAMRPDLRHYTDALRGVRATLRARAEAAANDQPPTGQQRERRLVS